MLDDTVPLYDEKGYQNVTSVPHESSFYAFFLLTGNCIGMSCYFLCYPDIHSETCEFKNLRINKNLNIYKILQLLLHYYITQLFRQVWSGTRLSYTLQCDTMLLVWTMQQSISSNNWLQRTSSLSSCTWCQ